IAAKFLGTIGFVPAATGFKAQEEHTRFLLAHRPSERHSFVAKHRAQRALVLHRAPRARPRILFQSLFAPGGYLLVTTRGGAGLSRRSGRINCSRLKPGAVFAITRRFAA